MSLESLPIQPGNWSSLNSYLAEIGAAQAAPPPSGDTTGATDTVALNALFADGVAVTLGAGIYWVNGQLNMTTHTALLGRGMNMTTIKRAANVSVLSAVGTNAVRSRNIRVANLTIDGNTGQGFTTTLVQQSFLSDPVMENVLLFGAEGIALDQLEVWDFQSSNLLLTSCGGNSSGTLPAHRMRCSTTDTVNNIHLRGYRNEGFGPDGAIVVQANSTRVAINIELTDFKLEQHGNAGIIASFDQVQGLKLRGGGVSHTGPLAAGVAQGIDLFSFSGGENLEIDGVFLNPGSFATSDVRSLFNVDGSVHAVNGITLSDIDLHQGAGSQPIADIRFAGTVNNYYESNVAWSNKSTWTEPHWTSAPTTLAPATQWPSPSLITGGSGKWFTVPSGASTAAPVDSTVHATPFLVSKATTFAAIAVNTTIAGAAGSLYRLGIYADNGSGYPGAKVLDAGTVATDTAAGFKQIAISQALDPGLYWLAAVAQGGVAVPTCTAVANPIPFMIETSFTGVVPVGFTEVAAGALQSPFSVAVSTVSAAVRVWLGT